MAEDNANAQAADNKTGNTGGDTGGNTSGNATDNKGNSAGSSSNTGGANTDNKGATDDKAAAAAQASTGDKGAADKGATGDKDGAADKTAGAVQKATDDKNNVAGDWPTDWRAKLAGDDKKLLAQLDRYASPVDLAKKIREQDALIAAGAHKKALPKDPTPEQIAQYRKDNNIPETADKYDLTMPDGLVIGEADKPIINGIVAEMHNRNLDNETVKAIIASYYKQEGAFLADREGKMQENYKKQDDVLRKEMGDDYRVNLQVVENLLATWTPEAREIAAGGFDQKGFPLKHNAAWLREMATIARQLNPIDHVAGGGSGNQMSSVEDEIKTIEAKMGGTDDERDAYFKDEKMQARLRTLYEFRENNKSKAA